MNILIIHDHEAVRSALVDLFPADSRRDVAEDAEDGLSLAGTLDYDAIVFGDVSIKSQFDLQRSIRERTSAPAIYLAEGDLPVGFVERMLDAGADDVVRWPDQASELLARIKAVVRRAQGRSKNTITVGPIVLDDAGLTVNGHPVRLTVSEARLFRALAERAGRTVGRDTIMSAMYGDPDHEPESKIIDVLVCKIRGKLRAVDADQHLVNDWGRGYALHAVPPVGNDDTQSSIRARVLTCLTSQRAWSVNQLAAAARGNIGAVQAALRHFEAEGYASREIFRTRRSHLWSMTAAGREYAKSITAQKKDAA